MNLPAGQEQEYTYTDKTKKILSITSSRIIKITFENGVILSISGVIKISKTGNKVKIKNDDSINIDITIAEE